MDKKLDDRIARPKQHDAGLHPSPESELRTLYEKYGEGGVSQHLVDLAKRIADAKADEHEGARSASGRPARG